jgi:hypothetical protein
MASEGQNSLRSLGHERIFQIRTVPIIGQELLQGKAPPQAKPISRRRRTRPSSQKSRCMSLKSVRAEHPKTANQAAYSEIYENSINSIAEVYERSQSRFSSLFDSNNQERNIEAITTSKVPGMVSEGEVPTCTVIDTERAEESSQWHGSTQPIVEAVAGFTEKRPTNRQGITEELCREHSNERQSNTPMVPKQEHSSSVMRPPSPKVVFPKTTWKSRLSSLRDRPCQETFALYASTLDSAGDEETKTLPASPFPTRTCSPTDSPEFSLDTEADFRGLLSCSALNNSLQFSPNSQTNCGLSELSSEAYQRDFKFETSLGFARKRVHDQSEIWDGIDRSLDEELPDEVPESLDLKEEEFIKRGSIDKQWCTMSDLQSEDTPPAPTWLDLGEGKEFKVLPKAEGRGESRSEEPQPENLDIGDFKFKECDDGGYKDRRSDTSKESAAERCGEESFSEWRNSIKMVLDFASNQELRDHYDGSERELECYQNRELEEYWGNPEAKGFTRPKDSIESTDSRESESEMKATEPVAKCGAPMVYHLGFTSNGTRRLPSRYFSYRMLATEESSTAGRASWPIPIELDCS